jgi:hypothetical protein
MYNFIVEKIKLFYRNSWLISSHKERVQMVQLLIICIVVLITIILLIIFPQRVFNYIDING